MKVNQALECLGYRVVKIWCREQKKRKRVNGRARGFYEGKYIYLRVQLPDGGRRDIYLGRPGEAARPRPRAKKPGGETAGARAAAAARGAGWRKRGEKGDRLDTRDPHDDRTLSLFDSPSEKWKRSIQNPKTGLRKYRR